MNFFTFSPASSDPDLWSISSKFWIYWVTTVPVTLLTVAVWLVWQHSARNTGRRTEIS